MRATEVPTPPGGPNRPDIARSWRRAALLGLDPESHGTSTIADVDRSSRLISAAGPILDELAERLSDQSLCLLLVDRDGRVVHARSGDARLRKALEGNGVAIGSGLGEESAGTNGPGTALELGRGVEVNGSEHFLNALKGFSCYGHPIRHPLTRRIEGALDITAVGGQANPLFGPLLAGAVRDIEARIVEGARDSERRMFLAFQNATRLRSAPVAVVGGDLILANRACLDRLGTVDPAVLGTLLHGTSSDKKSVHLLDLGPRGRVRVLVEHLEQTAGGALFYLGDVEAPSALAGAAASEDLEGRKVLIAGEPGTGRTSIMRSTFETLGEIVSVDAVAALSGTEQQWAQRFVRLVDGADGPVVVDEAHLLPARLCELVRRVIVGAPTKTIVLTACPVDELPEPAARMAALCDTRIEPKPLRERAHELPGLIATIAQEAQLGSRLQLTPRALAELAAYPWPGNLAELSRLVRELGRRPLAGPMDAADLPTRYRSRGRSAVLGGRERAERVALIAALESAGGNKSQAADQLGISRTTLYRRMQALEISG